ncbi:hypothetical protein GHK86_12930 [Acidimicrobiaceae bacterium USS-CC1]|uniref:Uncharacterized protein n=1 Tax=Acidiferrimicrobium australe TaxID=2664430 RepID=A0ABW9QVQ4_9ACTN|nr:hypothetical protein [Acidiferrimicrobium australe]
MDAADPGGLPRVVTAVEQRLDGHLAALLNSAGTALKRPDGAGLGVVDAPTAVWQQVLAVNCRPPRR